MGISRQVVFFMFHFYSNEMTQKNQNKIIGYVTRFCKALTSPSRVQMFMMMLMVTAVAFAQNTAGNYAAGTTALGTVSTEIAKYVPVVVKLCYAIAGVVAVIGAISVYIKMNNEEQDVKKSIMMIVGACIFLIAAAQALPLFFGIK